MSNEEIVAAAAEGYPPGVAVPLLVSQHGDHAGVLLETGSGGHSYPCFVQCRRKEGKWVEVQSSNMGGWYRTEDDAGLVIFFEDAEGLAEPIEVQWKGRRFKADTDGMTCWAIWWDELDPSNYIDPIWPTLAR